MIQEGYYVIPYLDSIAGKGEAIRGLILENPLATTAAPPAPDPNISWIYLILTGLFIVVALRFRKSPHFIRAIATDLTDTRERGNVFDDTVRETSLLVLLNILWSVSAGVMLWSLLTLSGSEAAEEGWSFSLPDNRAGGIGLCMGIFILYTGAMLLAYWIVGNVFTDSNRTLSWIKGATASTALETVVFFPVALLLLCQPQWTVELLIIGASAFIIGKLVFIFKGFRIFFTRFSSWMVFLYYLCSLEIVPLILTYLLSLYLCSILL